MKDKVTFNYKMYRLACSFMWLVIVGGFIISLALPIENAEGIGFVAGLTMVYGTLLFGGLGLLWEVRDKFRKAKEMEAKK
jgi:polyferredoxin